MTFPLFLADFDAVPGPGDRISVLGEEAHHGFVKRIAVGEEVLLSNGRGLGVSGTVVSIDKRELVVEVVDGQVGAEPAWTWTVAQALAKGDRSELAVQMATEVGARGIWAWQASRSIVRWSGDRAAKGLAKWRATARESAKQARRLWLPEVASVTTNQLIEAIGGVDQALVLHEAATGHIADLKLAPTGTGLLIVGPEGGISPEELERFVAAGATPVLISDGVLRTSTAAAVALGQLEVVTRR